MDRTTAHYLAQAALKGLHLVLLAHQEVIDISEGVIAISCTSLC